jgi:hypothetical protein
MAILDHSFVLFINYPDYPAFGIPRIIDTQNIFSPSTDEALFHSLPLLAQKRIAGQVRGKRISCGVW